MRRFAAALCLLALLLFTQELTAASGHSTASSHRAPAANAPTATPTIPPPPGSGNIGGTGPGQQPAATPTLTPTVGPVHPRATSTATPRATATATATAQPASPTPTGTAAVPAISIASALLYHSVNGTLKPTTSLKLGERGWFEVAYRVTNTRGLTPTGSILVGKGKKTLFAGSMPPAITPGGQPGFAVQGTFRPGKLAGGLYASFIVHLGTLKAVFPLTFTVVRG